MSVGPVGLLSLWCLVTCMSFAAPAMAEVAAREQDIVNLRLGQRILVDDGSCPAGQIKEVSGSQITPAGVVRVKKCVPRTGTKRR